jgi:hypothetical protein
LKCSEVRDFLSEISEKSPISTEISESDLELLCSGNLVQGGCVLRTSKADHDLASSDLQNMEQSQQQLNEKLAQEKTDNSEAQETTAEDQKKISSPFFGLHGGTYKDTMRQKLESDQEAVSKDEVSISGDEKAFSDYIQKKSAMDQLVPYGDDEYLSLTPAGVLMLNTLNARMSRVSDMEFSDFVRENNETDQELRGIAQRASFFVSKMKERISLGTSTGGTQNV